MANLWDYGFDNTISSYLCSGNQKVQEGAAPPARHDRNQSATVAHFENDSSSLPRNSSAAPQMNQSTTFVNSEGDANRSSPEPTSASTTTSQNALTPSSPSDSEKAAYLIS